jgi:hypothetical protein
MATAKKKPTKISDNLNDNEGLLMRPFLFSDSAGLPD